MHARTVAAAVLSFTATVIFAIEIASWPASARFGPDVSSQTRCLPSIVAATEADRAHGLQPGDRVRLTDMDFTSRLAVAYRYLPMQSGRDGEALRVVVERGAVSRPLTYLLRHENTPIAFVLQIGFKLFMLGLGLLVLWRGRDRASFMLGVWCLGIMVALPDSWWGLFSPPARLVAVTFASALWTYSPLPLYLIVESLAPGVSWRTRWIARIVITLTLLPAFVDNVFNAVAKVVAGCEVLWMPRWFINDVFILPQLAIMGFFILYYLHSSGMIRQRLRWVFWAFLISRFGVLLNLLNRMVAHPVHLSGIEWLTVMIFPLGCAYAILRHRIIDVNFVLNRTLIYTVLTTFAVGIFIILESLLGHFAVARGVGLIVEVAVALALGLSFNALHRRVESVIDRVLFRRKYEAARLLQQLADEAAYMEDPDALLARSVREVPAAVAATGAAVYERIGDEFKCVRQGSSSEFVASAPVDDLALVRLRMKQPEIHLSELPSVLGTSGMVFPLSIRGQLFGAFVCGARMDGELYAPDEIRMLGRVIHELGAELFAMHMRRHQDLLADVLSGAIGIEAAQQRLQGAVLL